MGGEKSTRHRASLEEALQGLRRRLRSSEERRVRVERRFKRMRAVMRACAEMSSVELGSDEVLEALVGACVNLVFSSRCGVLIWKADHRSFDLVALKDSEARTVPLPASIEEIASEMILASEPRVQRRRGEEVLYVPLKGCSGPLGVVFMVRDEARSGFSTDDVSAAVALASQAASAIERERLFDLATTDGLTGVFTRRHFMKRFAEEIRRTKRFGRPVSLILLDVDHFKTINDTLGHQVGDEVIRGVARVLADNLRVEIDLVGRYGGDEFGLVLPETNAAGAQIVARRLLKLVSSMESGCRGVTLSMGVATCEGRGDTVEKLISKADEALYRVKAQGRNGVAVWGEEGVRGLRLVSAAPAARASLT